LKNFVRNLRGSLPDIHVTIEDIVAEDDKVMVRILLKGTHLGPGLGVLPTGRRIRIAGIVLVRISKGQITEGWNSWDQLGLLRQIGALPAPKGEDRFVQSALLKACGR
jgi:predicted ester cyclase